MIYPFEICDQFRKIDRILNCFLQEGMMESQEELASIRDHAIRFLYPDWLVEWPKSFVCAECGKVERSVDAIIKGWETLGKDSIWYFHKYESAGVRGTLAACCTDHWKKMTTRIQHAPN